MAELSNNNRLEFRDFGVFETRTRIARVAQNPKTLERVKVPSKRTVKFKMGRMMKDKLTGNGSGSTIIEVFSASAAGRAVAILNYLVTWSTKE